MPFRCRQKMPLFGAGSISFVEGSPNPDTGIYEFKDVPQQLKLPDVEMTDLAATLKAGVDLKQVNCKLIQGDVHGIARVLGDFKEPEDTKPTLTNITTES